MDRAQRGPCAKAWNQIFFRPARPKRPFVCLKLLENVFKKAFACYS